MQTHTYIDPTWETFLQCRCVHAQTQDRDFPMHVYVLTRKDVQLAAGTHTDIQTTLISIQATQTHFQVLSNEKADMLFATSASSSPLSVEQIHVHHQILRSTSLK